jgi:hypothetical protein
MKTLREYIDQLDEISRRDFLKGAGATAGSVATDALSAPWSHHQYKDEMDDTIHKSSSVVSNDGQARLLAPRNTSENYVSLNINDRIDFDHLDYGNLCAKGRIKIGSMPASEIHLNQITRGTNQVFVLGLDKNYARINFDKILFGLKKPTTVKIEVPIFRKGRKIYTFEIEPDVVTRNIREE